MSEAAKSTASRVDDAGTVEAPGAAPDTDAPVFPYLVYKEFLAALLISIVLMVWSLSVNAPLLAEADPGRTENPAKAPWYFVGLQELLVYFDPWIAGVAIPTLIIVGLMAIPYLDTSRTAVGRYTLGARRLAIGHFLFGFALWWVLILIGQFFRGANWYFFWPWQDQTVLQDVGPDSWSFPLWLGVTSLMLYIGAGVAITRWRWPWLYAALGRGRYVAVLAFALAMYGITIKIFLRLVFNVKYVLVTPWLNV